MSTSEVSANNFWLIDFDRTLGNTPALYRLLLEVIADHGIGSDELDAVRRQVEATDGSFDALTELVRLRPNLSQARLLADYQRAAQASRADYLLPGARLFMERLDTTRQAWAILTYGGPVWQQAKLDAAGLSHVPALITSRPDKGRLIASWLRLDGYYQLPLDLTGANRGRVYRQVILVDDRLANFEGLPETAIGIHMTSGTVKPSTSVNSVDNLAQIDVASYS